MALLNDRFGRSFPYLRLSVIEACNFRCSYCLPQGYRATSPHPSVLSLEEIRRLLQSFANVGMRKIRLTGGEPSVRKDLTDIIHTAASCAGIEKVALTTNGTLLHRRWQEWVRAGLTNLNVSVDSLDARQFAAITGDTHHDVLLITIDEVLSSSTCTLKLNAVLLRGLNDDQLPDWLAYVRHRRIGVRFIELMQTGNNFDYFKRHHYRADEIVKKLREDGWRALPCSMDAGPAIEYVHPDYQGRFGIIAPYAKDFCQGCNRLRVTAQGDLRLCLFGQVGIPLRPFLQKDEDRELLTAKIQHYLGFKESGHRLQEGDTGLVPHLASVGG